MSRIGILAVQHESNTFLQRPTRWSDFISDTVLSGNAIASSFRDAPHEIGGFYEGVDRSGMQAVSLLAARATPGGIIDEDATARLLDAVDQALASADSLDGVLVAPHGAAVSESYPDFDGYWLSLVRKRVGPAVPIIGTVDLHANISAAMVHACDAIIAYHTNPHLDQRERGCEAALLMAKTLRDECRPRQWAALLPMIVGIERQNTAEQPCRGLFDAAMELEKQAGILSVSPVLGFPYADVAEVGGSLIVVADRHSDAARAACEQLARTWWEDRDNYVSRGCSVSDAVDRAATANGVVGLLDMGDNVGGGSPGDGTIIAREVAGRRGPPTLVCLWDEEIAVRSHEIGEGAAFADWFVGGKHDRMHGRPLKISGTVARLTDGLFQETGTTHGGKVHYDMGKTAVLPCTSGLTIVAHSVRTPPFSMGQITSCGMIPSDFQAIVLKGVQAPIAAYRSACCEFLRVNTPGVTTADVGQLEYSRRRGPLFPLESAAFTPQWVQGAH